MGLGGYWVNTCGVGHGQPDRPLNIRWMVPSIRWIVSEYSFGKGHGQPDMPLNIM